MVAQNNSLEPIIPEKKENFLFAILLFQKKIQQLFNLFNQSRNGIVEIPFTLIFGLTVAKDINGIALKKLFGSRKKNRNSRSFMQNFS